MRVTIERFDEVPEHIDSVRSTIFRDGVLVVNQGDGTQHGFPLRNISKWKVISDYDGPEA
jgi:hypothetical protein